MFRNAVSEAAKFTFPVVLSRKPVQGECTGGGGAFIVINEDGWIVTATHIIKQYLKLASEEASSRVHQQRVQAIRQDTSLSAKERSKQLKQLGHLPGESTERASAWWGGLGDGLADISEAPGYPQNPKQIGMDLAVARLTNFDKSKISAYPRFRSDFASFVPGVSLCKLGFPFFSAKPVFDASRGAFMYPAGTLPPGMFPIDGILTRLQKLQVADNKGNVAKLPFDLMNIETSSPGLRGQSGGPIFDTDGVVWGLQSTTSHTPLGFRPTLKINGKDHVEHQFINLGLGPSSITIIELLKSKGISFAQVP